MRKIRILSWNVNGLRAVQRKGFFDWLAAEQPDILCLQETKVGEEQLSLELSLPDRYLTYFNPAERKGYSRVAVYSKKKSPGSCGKASASSVSITRAGPSSSTTGASYYSISISPTARCRPSACATRWSSTMPFWNARTDSARKAGA